VIGQVFRGYQRQTVGIVFGLAFVGLVGIWDDIKRLSANVKLVGQIFAALFAYAFGLRISAIDLPFFDPVTLGLLSLPMTILWVVGVVNAVNLIDGLDGLAGGVLLFASIVNFISAVIYSGMLSAVLMVSIFGALLGFLIYNWHPAKIYLGDCGAYSLGFIFSVSGLITPAQKVSTSIAILVPLLAIGLPIFDTLLTVVRRFIARRRVFSPDRGHIHHILLDSGIGHRRVVVGMYLVCCVLCSLALVVMLNRNRSVGYLLLISSLIGFCLWGVSVKRYLKNAWNRFVKTGSNAEGALEIDK
jgi:UDP-GlcNAc:undecaprenyl-phosphate GlcNAc-1-phosphate transferase